MLNRMEISWHINTLRVCVGVSKDSQGASISKSYAASWVQGRSLGKWIDEK